MREEKESNTGEIERMDGLIVREKDKVEMVIKETQNCKRERN